MPRKIENRPPVVVNLPYWELEDFLTKFTTRAKYLYKIRTKSGIILPYQIWEPQEYVDQIIAEEEERTMRDLGVKRVQLLYLKGRQMGLSTDTSQRNQDKMLMNKNYHVQVVAHDDFGTKTIYQQYKTTFENLPDAVQVVDEDGRPVEYKGFSYIEIKPDGNPTKESIHYQNLTESHLRVFTAGKGDAGGKGGTINAIHFSECASYPQYDVLLASAMPQVNGTDIFVVKESTPNGISGQGEGFYKEFTAQMQAWEAYESGRATNFVGFRPVFLPWYWMTSYSSPLVGGKMYNIDSAFSNESERREYMDFEEQLITEILPKDAKFGKRDPREAANWYRRMIIEEAQRKIPLAKRYYPTTVQDAFLSTEKGYFNSKAMVTVGIELRSNPEKYQVGYLDDRCQFVPDTKGDLHIREGGMPVPGYENRYVIGLDQSIGSSEEQDMQGALVYDRLDRRYVAFWHSDIAEHQVPEEYTKLGLFYNKALLVPEANRTTVVNIIQPDGMMPYEGDIYFRMPGRRGSTAPIRYGYHASSGSNSGSREYALSAYKRFLDENVTNQDPGNYWNLWHPMLLTQHMNFIRIKNTFGNIKPQAAPGYHDDLVIPAAYCIVGDEWWEASIRFNGRQLAAHEIENHASRKQEQDDIDARLDRMMRDLQTKLNGRHPGHATLGQTKGKPKIANVAKSREPRNYTKIGKRR